MTVEIFSFVKNSEDLTRLFMNHYTKAFPGCIINILDNKSTDKTTLICKKFGANVKNWPQYTEEGLRTLKNNVWKKSKADWVIVCDIDELIQLNITDLQKVTEDVIEFEAYQMISVEDAFKPFEKLTHGYRDSFYDKSLMFRTSITEINYSIGAHNCTPLPKTCTVNKGTFKMFHYKEDKIATITKKIVPKHPLIYSARKKIHTNNAKKAVKLFEL